MKKSLTILAILVALMMTSSCQKDLPDSVKNVIVKKGGQTSTPTQTPDNPTDQSDIPLEEDNTWPVY